MSFLTVGPDKQPLKRLLHVSLLLLDHLQPAVGRLKQVGLQGGRRVRTGVKPVRPQWSLFKTATSQVAATLCLCAELVQWTHFQWDQK